MHILLVENDYQSSVWCQQIVQGLVGELRKRRENFEVHTQVQELAPDSTVFVIGAEITWLSRTIDHCNSSGIVPILLCNSIRKIPGGRYHCVRSDIGGSMRQLIAAVRQSYGRPIALYGINPHSVGDRSRAEAFSLEKEPDDAVFENNASLEDCFYRFLPQANRFRAVLCANGFAAISLYRRLRKEAPQLLPNLTIISCAQTLLSRYYKGQIISMDLNFAAFGKTALGLLDLIRKQPHISDLTATVKWSVQDMPLTSHVAALPAPKQSGSFYQDRELQRMLLLEGLLNTGDEIDMDLLQRLMAGESYATISQACFMSEGTVKYRIRKMCRQCGLQDKKELLELLRECICI